jgi:hypothetical protein
VSRRVAFCGVASEIEALLSQGRRREAIALAVRKLRSGHDTQNFLTAVADLLESQKRGRGRPKAWPRRWIEIGQKYEVLRSEQIRKPGKGGRFVTKRKTHGDVVAELAKKFGRSARTIEETVSFYRKALEYQDALDRGEA